MLESWRTDLPERHRAEVADPRTAFAGATVLVPDNQ
jgi:hypothetical protein